MESITSFLASHPSTAVAEAVSPHLIKPVKPATVRGWRKKNRIPLRYWPAFEAAYPQLTHRKIADMHFNHKQEV